jgi:MFS family permease
MSENRREDTPGPRFSIAITGRIAGRDLPRHVAFWLVGAIFVALLASSSVPSPIYAVYQESWGFSATVLTVVYGVYPLAVLASLLMFGSLSDFIGRRRVLIISLAVAIVSMALFIAAQGVGWLLAARAVQGIAVGTAAGAMSAALVELSPPGAPRRGTLVNGVSPPLGLGAGALGAGVLVAYAPGPTTLSYVLLLGIFAAMCAAAVYLPETAENAVGKLSIKPRRISVPPGGRRPFAMLSLAMIAVWSVGGFYLSLGPSLVMELLGSENHLVGALAITLLTGIATVVQLAVDGWPAHRATGIGLVLLLVGLGTVLLALAAESAPVLLAGSALLGLGHGATFLGAFRSLSALAPPERRAELLAAVYVVIYLSVSLPAIASGAIATRLGLHRTATLFAIAVAAACVLALAGLLRTVRAARPDPA